MPFSKQQIFTQAFGDYEKALLKRSLFKISNQETANDLVQTTFLKTWEYLLKHGKVDSMKAFLFHVLNNLIIDEYRKKKPVSLDALTDSGFQVPVDDTGRIYDTIDGKTASGLILFLTEKYRIVMSMHFMDDMSITEISEYTNQSKNTVAVQIHRGIEKLAVLYRKDQNLKETK